MHEQTRLIHGASIRSCPVHPVAEPIYLSTTYHRDPGQDSEADFIYARDDNPNRRQLEQTLAELSAGHKAYTFSSGMAAIQAVWQSLQQGDHVLLPDDAYYNIRKLAQEVYRRWGLEVSYVDMTDLEAVRSSVRPQTALIWIETPSNPLLNVVDIRAVCQIAGEHGVKVCVDNTWSTPILQKPLELGADLVIHSSTKYFGGHSDVMGGCVIFRDEGEHSIRVRDIQHYAGGVPSPFDCWLISRGLQTLSLRVRAQSESAMSLARYLTEHPEVEEVLYPGLPTHHQHHIAQAQMRQGYGAMLSVLIKGSQDRVLEVARMLRWFTYATSLGAIESLIEHRRSVEGPQSEAPHNLLRVSVGLEHIDDLLADWEQALRSPSC